MGGCALCRVGLGNPYSTRGAVALPHFCTLVSYPALSHFLAKVLIDIIDIILQLIRCPNGVYRACRKRK